MSERPLTWQPPESERGDLPDHVVPADLVELHQVLELEGRAPEGEQ